MRCCQLYPPIGPPCNCSRGANFGQVSGSPLLLCQCAQVLWPVKGRTGKEEEEKTNKKRGNKCPCCNFLFSPRRSSERKKLFFPLKRLPLLWLIYEVPSANTRTHTALGQTNKSHSSMGRVAVAAGFPEWNPSDWRRDLFGARARQQQGRPGCTGARRWAANKKGRCPATGCVLVFIAPLEWAHTDLDAIARSRQAAIRVRPQPDEIIISSAG